MLKTCAIISVARVFYLNLRKYPSPLTIMTTRLLCSTLTALTALLPVATSVAFADTPTVVQYTYDQSGNRIRRAVASETNQQSISAISNSDSISVVSASPNPTSGLVTVDIVSDEDEAVATLSLYSLEGTHLKDWGEFVESLQIDLSSYRSGWYIIHVYVGQQIESIKILKQ